MSEPVTFRSLTRIEASLIEGQTPRELFTEDKEGGGLTIFTPAWNHRPYLPRCLRSALDAADRLEEAGFGVEIVVADDASRDGSQKLLRSVQSLYGEERLKTLFLGQNLGAARLRNLALGVARFRHLCMLDADNELTPENVPLFLRAIAKTGATLAYGNLIAVADGEVRWLKSGQRASMRTLEVSQIDTFALLDAPRMMRIGGYDPTFFSMEDWEMVLHLIAEEEPIVFVPAVLGHYHINTGSKFRAAKPHLGVLKDHMRRVYSQNGARDWDPERVGRTYHPEVGFLD